MKGIKIVEQFLQRWVAVKANCPPRTTPSEISEESLVLEQNVCVCVCAVVLDWTTHGNIRNMIFMDTSSVDAVRKKRKKEVGRHTQKNIFFISAMLGGIPQ
jgi:hypothetical protein